MGLIDNLLARAGYEKKLTPRPNGDPIGAAAGAAQWSLPDPSIYENQADLFRRVSYIYEAVILTAQAAAAQPGGVYRATGEQRRAVDNHDFERLLLAPNPWQTQLEFLRSHYAYLLLNGNSYWWINTTSEEAAPIELWVIPPARILPHLAPNLGVDYYEYDPGDGSIIQLPNWQVVHFKEFHPSSMFVGLSRVEPIQSVAVGDIKTVNYLRNIYGANSGRLPGVLSFRSPIDDETWKKIKRDIKAASESNNYMLLRGTGQEGVDLLNAAATVKEMEIWQGRQMTREDIFGVFAPGLLNMTSVNATEANAKTGKQTFSEFTLYPMLTGTAQKMTQRLLPKYGAGLLYEFDDPRQVDRALELADIQEYSRYHTVREVRQEKYQSDPLGDERDNLLVSQITPPAAPVPELVQPAAPAQALPEPVQPEPPAARGDDVDAMADEVAGALLKWRHYEVKNYGTKKRDFAPDEAIPAALTLRITSGLRAAKSSDEVAALFDTAADEVPAIVLARVLSGLAK